MGDRSENHSQNSIHMSDLQEWSLSLLSFWHPCRGYLIFEASGMMTKRSVFEDKIFKTSVSTSINASSKETPNNCQRSRSNPVLVLPNNIEDVSQMLNSGEMEVGTQNFAILSSDLPPMHLNTRKRKLKQCNWIKN